MRLADIFADNMVLQRDMPICVFGEGSGEGCVCFGGEEVTFESDGSFRVYLSPRKAGGPYEMKVTLGSEERIFKNILVGDVYIAAGQSNMSLKLSETSDIELRELPEVRYFEEPHEISDDRTESYCNKGWRSFTPENEADFSAIAYYFASSLHVETEIPCGIISCNKGASRVDAWTELEIVNSPEYQRMIEKRHIDYYIYKFNIESRLYYLKLLPIVPYSCCGVIWYQGESNREAAEGVYYSKLFGAMVGNWRRLWSYKLPFYCVQLMPFDEAPEKADWAIIRSEQERASRELEGVYLTPLFATGEEKLIHPTHKRCVGEALANAVLADRFGRAVEYSGPCVERIEQCGASELKLEFSHSEGLYIDGDELCDCFVTVDGERLAAKGEIKDGTEGTLYLSLDKAGKAILVEMGYANVPRHNLKNSAGYLASPFKKSISPTAHGAY